MPQSNVIYIGVRDSVLALDRATGAEVWRTKLKGDFVNVVLDQGELYATTQGEVFRVDPVSGQVVWNNTLKGLGMGLVTVASAASPQTLPQEKRNRDAASSAGAATTATL
jgi:outer membrane protein assembly factor BamB